VIAKIKVPFWLLQVTAWVGVRIKALAYWLQRMARLKEASRAAGLALSFVRKYGDDLILLWDKYKDASKVVERLAEAAKKGEQIAARALRWLTVVDRMSEAAAARVIGFVEKYGAAAGDRWFGKWTALQNGKRAVKEAFEATEQAGEMADGAHDALVLAGQAEHPLAGLTYPREFAQKYGGRLETALKRLRESADDTRFPDGVVGQTVRDLSHPKLPALSDGAIEGAARSMLGACLVP
jgi:hypothetical protein